MLLQYILDCFGDISVTHFAKKDKILSQVNLLK